MMRRAEEQLGRAWAAGALPAVVNLFKGVNDVCLEKFGGEWGLVWRVDSSRESIFQISQLTQSGSLGPTKR
jgi:hypothetical protein